MPSAWLFQRPATLNFYSEFSDSVLLLYIQVGGSPSVLVRLNRQSHIGMQGYQRQRMTLSNFMGLQLKVCYAHEWVGGGVGTGAVSSFVFYLLLLKPRALALSSHQ